MGWSIQRHAHPLLSFEALFPFALFSQRLGRGPRSLFCAGQTPAGSFQTTLLGPAADQQTGQRSDPGALPAQTLFLAWSGVARTHQARGQAGRGELSHHEVPVHCEQLPAPS